MRYRKKAQWNASDLPPNSLPHRLAEALRHAAQATEAEFGECFRKLTSELESAFFAEESWMERMRLPTLKSHREQHARVLQGMHRAHAALMQGRSASGRKAVERLLPLWLPAHFSTSYRSQCIMPTRATSRSRQLRQ
jgi:hemerythrin